MSKNKLVTLLTDKRVVIILLIIVYLVVMFRPRSIDSLVDKEDISMSYHVTVLHEDYAGQRVHDEDGPYKIVDSEKMMVIYEFLNTYSGRKIDQRRTTTDTYQKLYTIEYQSEDFFIRIYIEGEFYISVFMMDYYSKEFEELRLKLNKDGIDFNKLKEIIASDEIN
ncbi:MAG: hypothetical protein JEZ08_04065 [Clostridiales bacterium]|nr:hypothetical protein [Clostridiales bacterium]